MDVGSNDDRPPQAASLHEQLKALSRISNQLGCIESMDELLRQAVEQGCRDLQLNRLSVWLTGDGDGVVVGTYGVDESGQLCDERQQRLTVSPMSPMGRVLSQDVDVWFGNDASLSDHSASTAGSGAKVVAGLWDGRTVIGALCYDNLLSGQPITVERVELIRLYAATLGHLVSRLRGIGEQKEVESRLIEARNELERRVEERTADLLASEERFRLLAENVPGVIYLCRNDARYTMLFLNDAVEELTGYPKAAFLDDEVSFVELYHPDDSDRIAPVVDAALAGRRPFHLLYRIRHRNGQWRWIEEHGVGVFRGGDLSFLEGYLTDVTDRVETESALRGQHDDLEAKFEERTAELRGSERQFRSLLAAVPDLILVLSEEGVYLEVHAAETVRLYRPAAELLGKTLEQVLPTPLAAGIRATMERTLATQEVQSYEYALDMAGDERWLLGRAAPFVANGKPAVIWLSRDITDRRQAEEQLRRHEADLQALASELSLTEERERRRIAADLHDRIGQSLSLVQIQLDGLRGSIRDSDISEVLTRCVEMVRQTVSDTRSLMFDLSPPVLYDFGFEAAVEWLVDQFQGRDGLHIELERDGSDKPLDEAMNVVLFRAVRELLINVTRYAQARQIAISIERRGDWLDIAVRDDGRGFDASQAGRRPDGSDGFGLFNIREQITRLGGKISIESVVDEGTCVILSVMLKTGT